MKTLFLITGYGIPKNMDADKNYQVYLSVVFNTLYSQGDDLTIICCGGRTDLYAPFSRTEAEVMIKKLKKMKKDSEIEVDWNFISENKSLSTLENLLNAKILIKKNKLRYKDLYIFCETTRENRTKKLAKRVFDNKKIKTQAVDFDTSLLRYIPQEEIDEREKMALKRSLIALKSDADYAEQHKILQNKIKHLRKAKSNYKNEEVRDWWKK